VPAKGVSFASVDGSHIARDENLHQLRSLPAWNRFGRLPARRHLARSRAGDGRGFTARAHRRRRLPVSKAFASRTPYPDPGRTIRSPAAIPASCDPSGITARPGEPSGLAFVQDDITPSPIRPPFNPRYRPGRPDIPGAGFRPARGLAGQGDSRAPTNGNWRLPTAPSTRTSYWTAPWHSYRTTRAFLRIGLRCRVAIACVPGAAGPHNEQTVLREALLQAALFGPQTDLHRRESVRGLKSGIIAWVLEQKSRHTGGWSHLDGQGSVSSRCRLKHQGQGLPVLIEETGTERLSAALAYAGWVLEHIDPRSAYRTWESRHGSQAADHSPGATQGGSTGQTQQMSITVRARWAAPVHLEPPHRTRALSVSTPADLIEDLRRPAEKAMGAEAGFESPGAALYRYRKFLSVPSSLPDAAFAAQKGAQPPLSAAGGIRRCLT